MPEAAKIGHVSTNLESRAEGFDAELVLLVNRAREALLNNATTVQNLADKARLALELLEEPESDLSCELARSLAADVIKFALRATGPGLELP